MSNQQPTLSIYDPSHPQYDFTDSFAVSRHPRPICSRLPSSITSRKAANILHWPTDSQPFPRSLTGLFIFTAGPTPLGLNILFLSTLNTHSTYAFCSFVYQ